MKRYPTVSIILLNYNGLEDTKRCMSSLLKTTYPNFNVVVADNGSKMNEAKLLKKTIKNKKVKIFRFNKNYGFTGGNNRIVERLKSKYIVFLNNDTSVEKNWLRHLVNFMEKNKNAAVCQSKILLMDNPSHFDYAGGCGGYIDKFGYPFTRGRVFFTSEKNKGQYDTITNLFWSSGAAMMVRRKEFINIGKFDELFFLYMEEIDLCWRLLHKGFTIASVPTSIIYHKVAASAKKNMFKKKYYEHRNNLIMLAKNYSNSDLFLYLPQRLVFEIINLFFYFLKGDFVGGLALIRAHTDFWLLFPTIFAKRAKKQKSIISFSKLVYKNSIVFDYFILNRRKFSSVKL